jgi:hypothetical protein
VAVPIAGMDTVRIPVVARAQRVPSFGTCTYYIYIPSQLLHHAILVVATLSPSMYYIGSLLSLRTSAACNVLFVELQWHKGISNTLSLSLSLYIYIYFPLSDLWCSDAQIRRNAAMKCIVASLPAVVPTAASRDKPVATRWTVVRAVSDDIVV